MYSGRESVERCTLQLPPLPAAPYSQGESPVQAGSSPGFTACFQAELYRRENKEANSK